MPLLERIQKDLVGAMKSKDEARLSAIRMIKTALKKVEVDSMKPLDEAAEMAVLNSLIKQRTESAEMLRKGVRIELAEKEEVERALFDSYIPGPATTEAIEPPIPEALSMPAV